MTDADLLAKKLAFIDACLADLERLADTAALRTDLKEQRFVAYTVQIAIQSALDAASHIVSSERLGEPSTNRALFDLLAQGGWIPSGLVPALRDMSGFRDVVVHGYQEVDLDVLEDVLAHRLGDLSAFCTAIRARLAV